MKKILLVLGSLIIALNQNAQTELWGMTQKGGKYGVGVIFKTDGSGNNQVVEHDFYQVGAAKPYLTNMIQATDGKLYGMASEGGAYDYGVIFQYDPLTNTYITKHDFNGNMGAIPFGSLIQASNGKLYGMTSTGGVNLFCGVLFQYDPVTNIFTKLFDFDNTVSGQKPYGSLLQASDGNLYGMTASGGASGAGVIFQYNPTTNVFTKKIDFSGAADGGMPYSSLMIATNGFLYGTTSSGGANNMGVLFQYDIVNSTCTKKLDFNGSSNGNSPRSVLTQAVNGMLYGLTYSGGINNVGVLFQYDPVTDIYTKKMDFTGSGNGANPESALIQHPDGTLYGTTGSGGVNLRGVLFQYDPGTNTYSKKHDFNDGNMRGSLVLAQDGHIYGMTNNGGIGKGILFQYDPVSTTLTRKLVLSEAINGAEPLGSLVKGTDGELYGLTNRGGAYNNGVLFQYDPVTHTYNKKYDFNGVDGSNPSGSLIQATDGMFYGLTTTGGGGYGVIFKFDPTTGIYTKLQDLFDATFPSGSLLQATNGKLYGMSYAGWPVNYGTIFEYDIPADTCIVVHIFTGPEGRNPVGSLIQASDNMLYGITEQGGYNGTLFQYNPVTGICTLKYDFGMVTTDGTHPINCVIEASPGKLFGLTSMGGASDKGVIYTYDIINNSYNTEYEFSAFADGTSPMNSLLKASDGNLYGMTPLGGLGGGVVFQYDPITSIYTKKMDFIQSTGRWPAYSNLIEISGVIGIKENNRPNNIPLYPNPNSGSFTIDLKSKSQVVITNVLGETIYDQMLETGKKNIDILPASTGFYFVKVIDITGCTSTQKVVINR